ncbi:MAG: DUF2169 domain-containing protein [Myxococcales bacterium FL481]|nr:MAG: DUF2169 domain-containing protein [Myxococcales bacterium FL481]
MPARLGRPPRRGHGRADKSTTCEKFRGSAPKPRFPPTNEAVGSTRAGSTAVELYNHTQLQTELISGSPANDEDLIIVQVVGKAIGQFDPAGHWTVHWDADAPILRSPLPTPWGDIPSDVGLRKQGCDVVALGRAYSSNPHGAPSSAVQLAVGGDSRQLLVYGDRYWERRGEHLVPSSPEEFVAFDLTWNRSFGGRSIDDDGNDVVFPYNIDGCGYQVSESVAEGERLPNLEDPADPIRSYRDTPRPCNIAPVPISIPLAMMGRVDELTAPLLRREQLKLPPELGNIAHPNFQFSTLAPGQRVMLAGMTPERPLELALPKTRFLATATIGAREFAADLQLETLLFLPEAGSCTLTWRTRFAYRFVPHELRHVRLDAYAVE